MKKIKNFGIGVDIEDFKRFEKLDTINHSGFLNKIFTKKEIDYCFSKEKPAPHLAVRYTAKEATTKALNSIGKMGIAYKEIEIINNREGVPMVKLNNKKFNKLEIKLSLSHSNDKAISFVVAAEFN